MTVKTPKNTNKKADKSDKSDKDRGRRDAFVKIFHSNYCHIHRSCQAFGIHRDTYYDWYSKYPDFAEKCESVRLQIRGLSDDTTIRLLLQGNVEVLKIVRKSLGGTLKFPLDRRISYNLKNLNTLEEIKSTRLKVISDFGDGLIDIETMQIINGILNDLVNNIVANEGYKELQEGLAIQKKLLADGRLS